MTKRQFSLPHFPPTFQFSFLKESIQHYLIVPSKPTSDFMIIICWALSFPRKYLVEFAKSAHCWATHHKDSSSFMEENKMQAKYLAYKFYSGSQKSQDPRLALALETSILILWSTGTLLALSLFSIWRQQLPPQNLHLGSSFTEDLAAMKAPVHHCHLGEPEEVASDR